jgi:ribosome production factor 2
VFNGELLDMFEFGVEEFAAMHQFRSQKAAVGAKPCILLDGPEWENSEQMRLIGNFLVDFFQGTPVTKVNLAGLDRIISLSSRDGVVHFRHYSIALKKSGTSIPRVDLTEMGPRFDLRLRRSTTAAADVRKESLRVPAQLRPVKRKNVSTNVFGEKIGRIHMPRQELGGMINKKIKALKNPPAKRRRTAAEPLGQDASNDY